MAPPFQRLAVLAPNAIICAARGPQILTFAKDGQVISSWTHPSARSTVEVHNTKKAADAQSDVDMNDDGPPAKKRRTEGINSTPATEPEVKADTPGSEQATNGKGQRKQRAAATKQEHQFIINLVATKSGSHVVAVSGQDKALWVLAHDGSGILTELSQRVMPKRPSSVDITEDEKTIVCADKFGDVYGLPLELGDPSEAEGEAGTEVSYQANPSAQGKLRVVSKKGANELTVHSKRNLRALEEQRRHQEQVKDKPKDGPDFEHSLLLGHVSMLTAILSVQVDNRPYLLTADRDEHIRISRGIPQAHVIEGFCLGHTSFVNALCIPPARRDILVSGGGDKELFVWKWQDCQLLAKVDLLTHAQKVVPGVSQISVSRLVSYTNSNNQQTAVLAICEKIPAVFVFNLQQVTLELVQIIKTPANPLDSVVVQHGEGRHGLVVGIDSDNSSLALIHYEQDSAGESWAQEPRHIFDASKFETEAGPEVSREDLDRLLYTVENLRKTDMDEAGDEDGEPVVPAEAEGSGPKTPA